MKRNADEEFERTCREEAEAGHVVVVGTERNQWRSCAEWDAKHKFPENTTTDEHQTKEQAEAVCRGLRREGLGGERIHFPVRTWVEPIT